MINNTVQLTFDLGEEVSLNRDDFIASSSNKDALAWIDSWPNWPVNVSGLNVFGAPSSGKSHLANIWKTKSNKKRRWLRLFTKMTGSIHVIIFVTNPTKKIEKPANYVAKSHGNSTRFLVNCPMICSPLATSKRLSLRRIYRDVW